MKKALLILLALSLILCASCSSPSLSETEKTETCETVETETETAEEETKPSEFDALGYADSVVNLATENTLYKTFGRTYVTEEGLNLDFAASGLEFQVECGGDVYVQYSCKVSTYFQVYVDGEEGIRLFAKNGENVSKLIAQNVPAGTHTIRIIRDTDATKNGELTAFSAISFKGKKETFQATAAKELYIEFIGDSITAGKYTETKYSSGDIMHKATNSYAYLTANQLDADFSVIARGGCGYFRVNTCPKTMNQLYPYYNGFDSELREYQTPRKADLVVLAMGTNDRDANVVESYQNGTVPFATYEEALNDMIKQIRGQHGEDVPIVIMHGMMNSLWKEQFEKAAEDENIYLVTVTQNRSGGNEHPSVEGHKTFTQQLTQFIEDNNILN